jgi:hypothetical protein
MGGNLPQIVAAATTCLEHGVSLDACALRPAVDQPQTGNFDGFAHLNLRIDGLSG